MLVRLVSAVLQRFLGHYVENLDTERLSYSLGYSGNVVLTDLCLKPDALNNILGTPLRLSSGRIARVQLIIPLTQLRSQPWSIIVEDAEIIINPYDARQNTECDSYSSNTSGCSKEPAHESRKAYLQRLESRWWQLVREGGLVDAVTTSPNDSSWWSYGVSLVYGIVSNLQVEIRNVHFAFVDDGNIIGESLTWGMRLSKMTVQATDESWNPSGRSSNQQIEFKSIDVVGLSVYYYDIPAHDSLSVPQERFLIPPSQFSVHLLRRSTPEPLTSETTPRIEVEAQLTSLRVDFSLGVLAYAHQLTDFLKQKAIPPHRPKTRPNQQPAAWWRYAAGEVVPALRRYHTQWPSDLGLQYLAEAATQNNQYVRAYQAHLLRGLGLPDEDDLVSIGVEHQEIEKSMSLDRVTLLRQVAMQRAARLLKQRRPTLNKEVQDQSPTVPTQPSQSWWPSFLSSSSTTESTEPKSPDEAEAPKPWRLWWWFSAAPAAVTKGDISEASDLQAEASPSSSEAALMLLNELVAARDVGQVLTRDRLFCRITARVDQFQLCLMEDANLNVCSLHADNLQLRVETRPREESLHFNARLHSLLLRDDRSRVDSQGRNQLPLFPNVISPLPQTVLESSSPTKSDLFRLDYITSRSDNDPNLNSNPPASLNIRTDPLRVICQPELFLYVMRFLSSASKPKSSQRTRADSSAYNTLKSQTKANLRAALHTVEKVDEESPLAVSSYIPSKSVSSDPSSSKHLSSGSIAMGARPSGLCVHLDIAAPRILLPERLWPASGEESNPTPHLLGVICDLGRFRLSNWEPTEEKEGNIVKVSSLSDQHAQPINKEKDPMTNNASEDSEESEAFATPCGTPDGSDLEPSPLHQGSARRRRLKRNRQHRLYETYLLELDEFRILAGRLDELQVSGLWPDLLPSHSSFNIEDGLRITQIASQVNLVDRFSLAIWITRRVVSMASLRAANSTLPSPPPTIPADLPGLLICVEQRHCVLRLSDSRLSALCRCVGAVTSIASSTSDEISESSDQAIESMESPPRSSLVMNHSLRFKGLATKSPSKLRRTIVVTFSMQELILQLDARGRPLAEFRLVSTAARFNRFTNSEHSKTTYDVCLQVHSLTVADALCGLGGDFDLLAASHRDVRLDTLSGSLSVTSPSGRNGTPPLYHSVSSSGNKTSGRIVVSRPFYDPIEGECDEDASTALIRVKYLQTKTAKKLNRNIDVKFRHLDLLGNLNTLIELISFVRYVVPYSESENKSSGTTKSSNKTVDVENATSSDDETSSSENLEMSISVERLSLVLIRVKMPNADENAEECFGNERLKTASAERLATITLLGANFQSRENYKDLRVSLAGLQVLDLIDVEKPSSSGVRHRHIFVAGRCLDPEISDVALTWSGAKSVFSLIAHRQPTAGYHVELDVTSPVYVHNPRALHEISSWLSNLYRWNVVVDALARKIADSAMSVENLKRQKEKSKTTSSLTSLHAVFEQPVVVFPAGPTSPKVLIGRLGRLTLRSDNSELNSPLSMVQLIISRASLAAFDIKVGVPRVRGTSEVVQAMLILAHYLRLIPSIEEHCVLEDISADLLLKREVLHKHSENETNSQPISWPEDFDSSELVFPFNEEVISEVRTNSESASESWLTVSVCLTQPLHVRLSKKVYCQLLQTLDNLAYSGETLIKTTHSEEVSESDCTSTDTASGVSTSSQCLAMRFRMPRLVVETFTEMSGERRSLGLTRFTLSEFFIAASMRGPVGLTHIEATIASLLLENLLPDYKEENRYLLFSHLPKKSEVVTCRRRPRVDSCPILSKNDCQPSFLDSLYGRHSRKWNRPSLSFSEKHGGRSRTNKSARHSSTESGQGNRGSGGSEIDSNSMDQFVKLRVLIVDKNNPLFNSKYRSTSRFVDVAFSSLTCYLSLHPWVLLLDFLGLGSPITACDDFDSTSVASRSTCLSNSDTSEHLSNEDLCRDMVTLTSLSVSTFSLLLDTVSSEASPLLRASASQLRVCLTNYRRSIEAGGDWMHLAGNLAAISVHDLTAKGSRLYSRRFLTNSVDGKNGEGDYLIFALTKYQLPDAEVNRRSEDGILELQLGPAYYIHTQEFLTTAIDTLDRFQQYQDLMNRVRQGAAISMRLRLNIKANAPIVLFPISTESENVLVCNLGTVTAVNDFCWHTDLIANEGAPKDDDPPREQPQKQSACKYCTSGIWWSDEYSSISSKDVMTQGFYYGETENAAENIANSPCLLDRIHLSLDHIEIYCGKRYNVEDVVDATSSRMLNFGTFCIIPEAAALTEPFGLTVLVERNLCGAKDLHAVPDWRLSARLCTAAPICIGLREYRILRGILAHNIGGSSNNSVSSVVGCELSGWNAASKACWLIAISIELNRGAIYTRRPYRTFAFTFDLEDVSICLSVPSDWASQRHLKDNLPKMAPFCRLDLAKSRLTYDSYSCGKYIIDLACSVATFTDTRFEGLPEPQNCFPVILSALSKPQNNIDGCLSASSPQFRVTQVVTPVGTADASRGNIITTSTTSSMTFNLRSMRLILALDWLADFYRFLTTQPIHPSSSTMNLSNEPSQKRESNVKPNNEACSQFRIPQATSDLRVFSDQTEFVLMENLSQADTNVAVLTGAMCFLLRSGGSLSQALMHLCLHGVGLHTLQGFIESSRAVIVEPTDLTVALLPYQVINKHSSLRSTSAGLQDLVTPRASLEIQTSTLRTHFSYTDGLLFFDLLNSIHEQAVYAFGGNEKDKAVNPILSTAYDASIARLVEMGFSAEDGLKALQSTDGQIDAAIVLLASPSKPPKINEISTFNSPRSLLVRFLRDLVDQLTPHISEISFHSGFSLCLIDDCIDADVPLAKIQVSDISLKWNLTGWAIGRVMGRLSANYYNRDLSALEPAIEPFLGVCDWRLRSDDPSKGDCAIIEVHSPDTININLTVALVRLTKLVLAKMKSSQLTRRRLRTPFIPFCLCNKTGQTLRFKKVVSAALTLPPSFSVSSPMNSSKEFADWTLVEPEASVQLPFQSPLAATGRGQSRVDDREGTRVPLLLIQVEGWSSAYPITLDRLGVFSRTIRLQQNADPHLAPATRLVIEIVRRGSAQNLIIVRSGLTVTNRLSPHLAVEVGLAHLPTSPTIPPTSVIESGLRVAFGKTEALPLSLAARRENGERLCFRPVLIGSGDLSQSSVLFEWSHQITFDISKEGGGMKFVTSLGEAMDWRRLSKPGEFNECAMSCRCLKSDRKVGLYSTTLILPRRPPNLLSKFQFSSPWQFCLTAVRDAFPPDPAFREASVVLPGHHLTLGPVLRVVNLLPCEMTFFLEGTSIRSRLPPNKATSVFEISCSDVVRFGVHLENFQFCETIRIPPATFSDTILINLYDQYKRVLQLKVIHITDL
ncbi:unnamed protein product [Rodentolepis nana]|uniref:UBA domain-containing protein n=1 Tax=Rodentolepis nana TaxID=102285 RepID=A0A158QGP5_RODNA|nr:unnamed protein product [Rodentolepis nana]